MKSKIQLSLSFLFAGFLIFTTIIGKAQATDGTMTLTFTETVSGYTKNVLAVWVQDNSGAFIKTKMRYWGNGTNDHLPVWKTNSLQNIVDASTGPTLTSSTNPTAFGTKTITWNGKNVSGITVNDGTYKILIESSWQSNLSNNTHNTLVMYTFEKGTSSTHTTPTGDANFSNITIDWVPSNIGIEDVGSNKNIVIFPNPANGIVQINFKNPISVSRLLIENLNGEVVYQEAPKQKLSGIKTIDLSFLPKGVYIVEILTPLNSDNCKTKLIINK
jgi:hypothetical protein